jgi:hypothetical protein
MRERGFESERAALLAGLLTHLSHYLESGCPRAASLAQMLLQRLDDSDIDQELSASCARLEDTIAHSHRL